MESLESVFASRKGLLNKNERGPCSSCCLGDKKCFKVMVALRVFSLKRSKGGGGGGGGVGFGVPFSVFSRKKYMT